MWRVVQVLVGAVLALGYLVSAVLLHRRQRSARD
jgi:hypothetical protein